MRRSVAAQSITAVAAAALLAGLVTFLSSSVPGAKAEPQIEASVHRPQAKSDRAPVLAAGAACSSQSWPNYDQSCQFDLRTSAGEARTVRVIVLR